MQLDEQRSITFLMQELAHLHPDKHILLRYSPDMTLQTRWTIWTEAGLDDAEPSQVGAGSSISEALQSAYKNTIRDIWSEGPPDAQ